MLDCSNLIEDMRRELSRYPQALHTNILSTWTPVWDRFSRRFEEAAREGDRAHALIALRYCTEAVFRVLFSSCGVYSNAAEPKWFPYDLSKLNASNHKKNQTLKKLSEIKTGQNAASRFDMLSAIWRESTS